VYDLELRTTHGGTLTGRNVAREEEVRAFIRDACAAWGTPTPDDVRDAEAFAARLVEDGEYRYAAQDVEVVVKRAV
jgi:hypothetical protein